MKVSADGQVTIPEEIQRRFGLTPGTEVQFDLDDDGVKIRPAATDELTPGERAVARLREAGRRHWIGPATTEETMELLRGDRDDPGLAG